SQDTIYVEVDLVSQELIYDLPNNRYWLRGADMTSEDYWGASAAMSYFDGSMASFYLSSAFRMNQKMFNNRRMLSYGVADFSFQYNDATILTDVLSTDLSSHLVPDFVSFCSLFEDSSVLPGDTLADPDPLSPFLNGYRSGLKLAAEGLGIVAYSGKMWYTMEIIVEYTAVMTGYRKGEEVFVYIPTIDTLMSVGLEPRANQINFSVYPNPAADVLHILSDKANTTSGTIFNALGYEVAAFTLN